MSNTTSPEFLCDDSIVHDPSLSLFQKVLLTTDGTVAQLLALYTGLPIRVHKLEHSLVRGGHPQWLMTTDEDPVLRRSILLCNDQQNLLYAESLLVIDRLPLSMQRQLLESDQPIGLLWRAARMETYREIIAYHHEPAGLLSQHFDLAADEQLLARTYLIHHQSQPLGMITEKFPAGYFRG